MASTAASAAESKKEEFEMEYRMLGGTGLKVSVLGFGTMTLNSKEQAKELIGVARKYGVNFFDNAELYGEPLGKAEEYFGDAYQELVKEDPLLWRRSDLVITTKLFFGPSGDPTQLNSPTVQYGMNEKGLSRKHIYEGMNNSLKRLKLDYVDIVMAHRWDPLTSTEEAVRAFTQIIRDGKAFYWGTSMWPAQKITEAYWIAKVYDLIPPIVEQPMYNMFNRTKIESELLPMFENPYQIGTTVWSPLDGGMLTGKYNKGIPKDSRLGDDRLAKWFKGYADLTLKKKVPIVGELTEYVSKNYNESVVNLALAWVIKNKNVSVCLLGGSKASQIEQNMGCIALAKKLDANAMKDIDGILKNTIPPSRDMSARTVKKIVDAQ